MTGRLDLEFLTAVALRRVRRGGVAQFDGRWLYRGRAMPGGMLRELYGYLAEDGLLEVHPADEYGTSRVGLTEAGQARYVALCQARRAQLPAPCPDPAGTGTDDPDTRRGWCVAACGCSLEVPPDGAVYVDCPGCAPSATESPADHRLSDPRTPAPGDRPDPPAEAVR